MKAIANFLMAAHGYSIPSRDEALRREKWVEERSERVGGMTGDIVSGGFSSLLVKGLRSVWQDMKASPMEQAYSERQSAHEALIAVNERITEEEAVWLADRIGRVGQIDDNEQALLEFVKEESPEIHPALKPLMEKVA